MIPAKSHAFRVRRREAVDHRVVLVHPGVHLRAVTAQPAAGEGSIRELVGMDHGGYELVEDAAG